MSATAWNAKLYNEKHAFVWEKGKDLLEQLAPRRGERILDLGCGTGHLTAEIASRGAEVVGVDRSAEMIAEARRQYPDLRFEVADALQLAFDEQFDAVFSNAVLHWIREPDRVIRGVARALRRNGRYVVEFGGRGNIAKLMAAVSRAWKAFGIEAAPEDFPWYYPSIGEYAALLENHGLEVCEARLFDRATRLEDGERGLEIWLNMFWQRAIDRVPGQRRDALLRAIEREARPELFRGAAWELDYRRLRIFARKAPSQTMSAGGH
jgi:SAM-dependent methyltransferase